MQMRGWLKGLPVKAYDVLNVKDAAELEKLCREWELHSEPPTDERR